MFVRLKMINRKVDPGTGSGWIILRAHRLNGKFYVALSQ